MARAGAVGALACALVIACSAYAARACDVCAIYTATEMRESRTGVWLGLAEQFSRYTTLKDDGKEIPNPGERLNSSITQLLLGYDVSSRFGLQLTLPIIVRDFRRIEDGRLRDGDESGIGDMSLLGVVRPYSLVTEHNVLRFVLLGGLKFPTGDSDRLREELDEDHATEGVAAGHAGHDHESAPSAEDGGGALAGHASGVHGHDLALGSGSYDGIIGGAAFASWQRFYLETTLQYAMRTRGTIDYRYANDLTWSAALGAFPVLTHAYTVAVAGVATGEHKGKDTLGSETENDTGITAVYMGPGVVVTWGTSLAADLETDFPILQDNTSIQLVPDYRVRAGVSWRF
jgi:hypothetical protein